jgi:RNA polymerase sigma-70 factor (ECF subfamily)
MMTAITTDFSPTDDELAARAARREADGRAPRAAEDAFARLYERLGRPLVAFLSARTRRDELDDLQQEVWKRIWAHPPGGYRGGNFRAWLFEIARNVVTDHVRKRRPGSLRDGDELLLDGRAIAPDVGLIDRERAEALRQCLARLSSEAAEIVRARLGGDDYPEVCRRLGLSLNRAYKLFHTAKRQLQACLERALG